MRLKLKAQNCGSTAETFIPNGCTAPPPLEALQVVVHLVRIAVGAQLCKLGDQLRGPMCKCRATELEYRPDTVSSATQPAATKERAFALVRTLSFELLVNLSVFWCVMTLYPVAVTSRSQLIHCYAAPIRDHRV